MAPARSFALEVTAWELAPPPEEGDELRKQRLDNFLTFWGPGGLTSPDDVEALETCQVGYGGRKKLEWSYIARGMNKSTTSSTDGLQMRTWWRRWNELITGETSLGETGSARRKRTSDSQRLRPRRVRGLTRDRRGYGDTDTAPPPRTCEPRQRWTTRQSNTCAPRCSSSRDVAKVERLRAIVKS